MPRMFEYSPLWPARAALFVLYCCVSYEGVLLRCSEYVVTLDGGIALFGPNREVIWRSHVDAPVSQLFSLSAENGFELQYQRFASLVTDSDNQALDPNSQSQKADPTLT